MFHCRYVFEIGAQCMLVFAREIKEGVIHRGRELQNSSYPMKVEFNNCFIIHSKYFSVLKSFAISLFVFPLTKIRQPHLQVFFVNGRLHF